MISSNFELIWYNDKRLMRRRCKGKNTEKNVKEVGG